MSPLDCNFIFLLLVFVMCDTVPFPQGHSTLGMLLIIDQEAS
jgi:hypothetical protein